MDEGEGAVPDVTFVRGLQSLGGYDPARATALAPQVSRNIYRSCCLDVDGRWEACAWSEGAGVPREACLGYDRSLLRSFQDAAGFVGEDIDGFYGPDARAALIRYGVAHPPPALYGGGSTPSAGQSKSSGTSIGLVLGGVVTGLGLWWLAARRRR